MPGQPWASGISKKQGEHRSLEATFVIERIGSCGTDCTSGDLSIFAILHHVEHRPVEEYFHSYECC